MELGAVPVVGDDEVVEHRVVLAQFDPRAHRSWVAFVEQLPYEVDVDLRSTFARRHPDATVAACPAAFLEHADGAIEQVLSADDINRAGDLDELRRLVTDLVARLESTT